MERSCRLVLYSQLLLVAWISVASNIATIEQRKKKNICRAQHLCALGARKIEKKTQQQQHYVYDFNDNCWFYFTLLVSATAYEHTNQLSQLQHACWLATNMC